MLGINYLLILRNVNFLTVQYYLGHVAKICMIINHGQLYV